MVVQSLRGRLDTVRNQLAQTVGSKEDLRRWDVLLLSQKLDRLVNLYQSHFSQIRHISSLQYRIRHKKETF